MAGRNQNNRIFNWHVFPVQLDGRVSIGASGAPTLITSSTVPGSFPAVSQQQSMGIQSITRLSAGRYRIQLSDNYTSLLAFEASFTAPNTGSALNVDASDAALSVGTVYRIVTVGTSTSADWHALGLPSGLTPAVGMTFKAAATGAGTGNGTASAIGVQAAQGVSVLSDSDMLNNQPFTQGQGGGYIDFQTVAATNSSTTTQVATDPSNTSVMKFVILLSNSSIR